MLKKTVTALAQSKYAHMLPHYNALPMWANSEYLSGVANSDMNYETYLRTFVEDLDAKYLSYDFYPWLSKQDGTEYTRRGYIKNLSIVREIANEYQIPVWSCKQCTCLFEDRPIENLIMQPNEAQFRWQMTVDVAYGVKGFSYFLLVGSALSYDEQPTWEVGMDAYYGLFNSYMGEPNVWFDYAKAFTPHLQLVDEVLMNSCNEGVIAHGAVLEKEDMGSELISSGEYRELKSVAGDASIVGCFNYKGGTALYVTNNSYTNSGSVTLTFRDNFGYNVYQGAQKSFKTGTTLSLQLGAGEGVLVVLE
jgi:hypothetical protein